MTLITDMVIVLAILFIIVLIAIFKLYSTITDFKDEFNYRINNKVNTLYSEIIKNIAIQVGKQNNIIDGHFTTIKQIMDNTINVNDKTVDKLSHMHTVMSETNNLVNKVDNDVTIFLKTVETNNKELADIVQSKLTKRNYIRKTKQDKIEPKKAQETQNAIACSAKPKAK